MSQQKPVKQEEPANVVDRRSLLKSSAVLLSPLLLPLGAHLSAAPGPAQGKASEPAPGPTSEQPVANPALGDLYPTTDPELARDMVGASHANLPKVQQLLEAHPALVRASWDWGFGDWETALGAASHMGNREIASILLAKGAPPTIFSAAMMGQLDTVKAMVAVQPGVEQHKGPHGIPLIDHAKAGGEPAAAVAAFLESLGKPGSQVELKPLSDEEVKMLCGEYTFGKGSRDRFEVTVADGRLGVARTGGTRRLLFHRGDFEFYPSGVESARLRFTVQGGKARALTVLDAGPVVKAVRV